LIVDHEAPNADLMRSVRREQRWLLRDPVCEHQVRLLCVVVLESFLQTDLENAISEVKY
jgi:hypothetical protein